MKDNDRDFPVFRYPKDRGRRRKSNGQESDPYLSRLIALLKFEGETLRPITRMEEELGRWYELLGREKHDKMVYYGLFSRLEIDRLSLTPEHQAEIANLKRNFYPLFLCNLYKHYERTEHLREAEAVLLEAKDLDCQGAELLLFSFYAEHAREMGKSDESAFELLTKSFQRAKEIDVFSDRIVNKINNPYFHAAALMELSACYRKFDGDTEKALECLVKTLRLELPDDVREIVAAQVVPLSL